MEDCFLEESYQAGYFEPIRLHVNGKEMHSPTALLTPAGCMVPVLIHCSAEAGGHVQTTQGTLLDCLVLVVGARGACVPKSTVP